MEERTQRLPSAWEKRPLEMTKEVDQGASVTARPTSRDNVPTAAADKGNYLDLVMRGRPSAGVAQRAQAPIPTDVLDVLSDSPGGFVSQHVGGGSFAAEKAGPGGETVINQGFPGPDGPMITKGAI